MPTERSAEQFAGRLTELATPERQAQLHRALQPGRGRAEEDLVLGVRMGSVFTLAKEFIDLVPREIDRLLDSPVHEVRVGAVSIMGKQALHKKTGRERRRELYEL